jgi:hypothetical protein
MTTPQKDIKPRPRPDSALTRELAELREQRDALLEACELVLACATIEMPAELMRAASQAIRRARGGR